MRSRPSRERRAADESIEVGTYFSNFYGGSLVGSSDLAEVSRILNDQKQALHFDGEVKWQKVTRNYLSKYEAVDDDLLRSCYGRKDQGPRDVHPESVRSGRPERRAARRLLL